MKYAVTHRYKDPNSPDPNIWWSGDTARRFVVDSDTEKEAVQLVEWLIGVAEDHCPEEAKGKEVAWIAAPLTQISEQIWEIPLLT